ncbi:MAG TPA: cupin domain-containing protein [Polyangiaceae bacterium]|nr:cupin domain-containing protein [Polyangiaceae bacterium]
MANTSGRADSSVANTTSNPNVTNSKSAESSPDTSVTKVDSRYSPHGAMGQAYLATGVTLGMRLWRNEPVNEAKPSVRREYEVVGYVLAGRAELEIEGQKVLLNPGDSYVVPRGASHHYRILESFSAVEATSPPAQAHGRDEPTH